MKHRTSCRIVVAGLWTAALLSTPLVARAGIAGPYVPDVATLHLYHLDEAATPSVDAASAGTNLVGLLSGATLGNLSYPGFGSALSTLGGGQDLFTPVSKAPCITPSTANPPGNLTFSYCDPATGAFTLEALVWIGFDPAKNLGTTANGGNGRNAFCMILTAESGANANRVFQFRIVPTGVAPGGTGNPATAPQPLLTFENIRMVDGQNQPTIFAAIPTSGPDAIVSNTWYHVAVTYNGAPNTANNIQFYWTLLDPSRTAANPIAITSAQTTLNGVDPLGSAITSFAIGNTARNLATAGNNFLGLVDEVRISRIARPANGMMFATPQPVVLVSPANATAVQGDPVALSVIASGAPTLAYQWRLNGTNLPGASLNTLSFAALQAANAGTYDVVVTNSFGAVTSAPALLTLRTPANLAWVGTAGATWDTSLLNWATNGDTLAETAYTERDDVTFGNTGSAAPVVTLTGPRNPHSVTVTGDGSYTLTTTNGATIGGPAQFTKSGNGTLILDVDCSFAGPATIQGGTVQLGNATARGSLGYGPVTNNGSLVVYRTGALSFTNCLAGTGSLVNNATNTITLSGTNLLSGPVTLNAGALVLAKAQAKGPATRYILNATANASGTTRLTLGGGVTFGPTTSLSLLGTSLAPDYRCSVTSSDSTNTLNGSLVLDGTGSITFSSDGPASNSLFRVTTPALNLPAFAGQLTLRGVGNGLLSSQLTLGGKVSKTDAGTWLITSTGNSWVATDVAGGILQMGANNVLPSSLTLNLTAAGATLDLAGFNQTVDTLTGPGTIASSSTVADSLLTVHPSGVSVFAGAMKDSVSQGTRKVGLTVSGGTLSLEGTNTYTGPTTVAAGASLQFVLNGCVSNTASLLLANGASLDATTRSDGTFTLNPGQTLQGDGQFNVTGNLLSAGTLKMKLSKSGTTLANDTLVVSGSFTCGGTLLVNLSASPALAPGDAFPLFSAGGGFSGAFLEVIPGPGLGLAWDTSTLASDGTLRVVASSVPATGTKIATALTADQKLSLSWPANYIGWRLQAQTNSPNAGLSTNWVYISSSSVTNQMVLPINKTAGSVFYRMVYP